MLQPMAQIPHELAVHEQLVRRPRRIAFLGALRKDRAPRLSIAALSPIPFVVGDPSTALPIRARIRDIEAELEIRLQEGLGALRSAEQRTEIHLFERIEVGFEFVRTIEILRTAAVGIETFRALERCDW